MKKILSSFLLILLISFWGCRNQNAVLKSGDLYKVSKLDKLKKIKEHVV